MLTCKQVSTALGEKDYAKMTGRERIGLRIHVALCFVCGQYNRQVMQTQDLIRRYLQREDEGVELPDVELERDAAEQMKAALRSAPPP